MRVVRGEQLAQRRHVAQLLELRERGLAPLVLLVQHLHLDRRHLARRTRALSQVLN